MPLWNLKGPRERGDWVTCSPLWPGLHTLGGPDELGSCSQKNGEVSAKQMITIANICGEFALLGSVLSFHVFTHPMLTTPLCSGNCHNPILQGRELRPREVTLLALSHTALSGRMGFEPRLCSARVPEPHTPPRLSFTFAVTSTSVPAVNLAYTFLWASLSRTCRNPWPSVHVLEVRH